MGLANAALLMTVLLWGSMLPVLDEVLHRFDPFFVNACRYLLAVPLSLLVLGIVERGSLRLPDILRPRVLYLGGGIIAFATLYNLGLAFSNPITAIAIMASGPLIASAVARFGFGEPPERGLWPALLVSVTGGMLSMLDFSGDYPRVGFEGGEPLLILAAASWAWYSLAAQRWMQGHSQLRITGLTVPAAGIWAFGIYGLMAAGNMTHVPPPLPDAFDSALIAWSAIGGAAVAVLFWNYGVKQMGVVLATMYLNLIPIVGVLVAMAFGVQPRLEQLAGGALVVGAVAWTQLRNRRRGVVQTP